MAPKPPDLVNSIFPRKKKHREWITFFWDGEGGVRNLVVIQKHPTQKLHMDEIRALVSWVTRIAAAVWFDSLFPAHKNYRTTEFLSGISKDFFTHYYYHSGGTL